MDHPGANNNVQYGEQNARRKAPECATIHVGCGHGSLLSDNGLVEVNCFSNGVVCGIYGGNELQPQPTLKNGDRQLAIQNRMNSRTAAHAVLEVRRALLMSGMFLRCV